MPHLLRLREDVLSDNAGAIRLPALARMIFVVHGTVTIGEQTLSDGEAWHGEGAATFKPGRTGATCWRWEFVAENAADGAISGAGVASREKLTARLDTLPAGDLLWRGDSVGFPPGGCAYLHRHQGPGIRCVIEGGLRIDTHGRSTCYGPGAAWYETGPDSVFAQAAMDRPTRFIRVLILPRALIGKSSIQYLNEEDKAKPKSQQYKIFIDAPIARP
jgi:hypothetical protein